MYTIPPQQQRITASFHSFSQYEYNLKFGFSKDDGLLRRLDCVIDKLPYFNQKIVQKLEI